MEGEVERLTNLKATRMRELALIRRTELEEICRTAHIEPDMSTAPENVSALIDSGKCMAHIFEAMMRVINNIWHHVTCLNSCWCPGIVNSSELLASIELQISKAKEETIVRKEIMDRVNKWLTACTEENWLEDYDQVDCYCHAQNWIVKQPLALCSIDLVLFASRKPSHRLFLSCH